MNFYSRGLNPLSLEMKLNNEWLIRTSEKAKRKWQYIRRLLMPEVVTFTNFYFAFLFLLDSNVFYRKKNFQTTHNFTP